MLTVIMNFHFFRGKDNNNNTNITLLSSTVRCFSLYHIDIIKPRSVRFAKQHQNPRSRSNLFTSRIWVHAMIGLLKKLLLICQSGLKEIRNTLYSHTHPLSPWYKFIESLGGPEQGSGFDYVCNTGYCKLFTRHFPHMGRLSVSQTLTEGTNSNVSFVYLFKVSVKR